MSTISTKVTTTDATVTSLWSFDPPLNSDTMLVALVSGHRTNGTNEGAGYVVYGRARNNAGTVTIAQAQPFISETTAAWNAAWAVVGSSMVLQVTGSAANTVNWSAEITRVGSA